MVLHILDLLNIYFSLCSSNISTLGIYLDLLCFAWRDPRSDFLSLESESSSSSTEERSSLYSSLNLSDVDCILSKQVVSPGFSKDIADMTIPTCSGISTGSIPQSESSSSGIIINSPASVGSDTTSSSAKRKRKLPEQAGLREQFFKEVISSANESKLWCQLFKDSHRCEKTFSKNSGHFKYHLEKDHGMEFPKSSGGQPMNSDSMSNLND